MSAVVLAAVLLVGVTAGSDAPVGASGASTAGRASVAQAAQCVRASNWQHVVAGRADLWLIFVWAKGSDAYVGTVFTTTSLREGPAGTWTMVPQCDTQPPPPDGAAIYQQNCAVCHGADGSGGVGPSLLGIGHHSAEELIAVVTNGRGAMPAWGGELTAPEIAAVVDYIRTFPGEHDHEHPTTTTTAGTTTTTAGTTTTTAGTTTTTAGTTTTTAGTTTTTVHEHDHEH